jgi:uncharacterized protein
MTSGNHSNVSLALAPDLVLDARRAVWFPNERVLAVADLHLGYAWVHRSSGQLLPLSAPNDSLARLQALQGAYEPNEIVFLGDIVHRAVALEAIEQELRTIVTTLAPGSTLTFLSGNHDRHLARLLQRWKLPIQLRPWCDVGPHRLLHGDAAGADLIVQQRDGGRIFMGHEHPAVTIGDGVTTSQKCPCFLVSDKLVVLPAFSRWAAGTNVRAYPLMSALARAAKFQRAVAICGERLLPIRL